MEKLPSTEIILH